MSRTHLGEWDVIDFGATSQTYCLRGTGRRLLSLAPWLVPLGFALAGAASASASEAKVPPEATGTPTVLAFVADELAATQATLVGRLKDAAADAFGAHGGVGVSFLSPDLPAVRRAIRERVLAPEALDLLTSTSARQVLCRALGFDYGLVLEEIAPLPATVERKGLALAATLLSAEGGRPRILRAIADDERARLDSVAPETLSRLSAELVKSVVEAVGAAKTEDAGDPGVQADRLLREAADHMAVGKYGLAIEAYNHALRLRPRSADLFFRLGNAYAAKEDFNSAAIKYKNTLYLEPDHHAAALQLARAYEKLGDRDAMLNASRKLVKRAPDVALHQQVLGEALVLRRTALLKMGNRPAAAEALKEARQAFERAIELSDDKLPLHRQYALLLSENEEHAAAAEAAQKALKVQPGDPQLRRLLWTSLLYAREYESALEELFHEVAASADFEIEADESLYRKLAIALDRRARREFIEASQNRQDLADGKLTREQFLSRTQTFRDDADRMSDLVGRIAPPKRYAARIHTARHLAYELMGQWAVTEINYVETMDALYRDRAIALQKQATTQFDTLHALEREMM